MDKQVEINMGVGRDLVARQNQIFLGNTGYFSPNWEQPKEKKNKGHQSSRWKGGHGYQQ